LRIVIVSDTLLPGGAESFSLRLAEELHLREHEVHYYVLRKNRINHDFKSKLAPRTRVYSPSIPFMRAIEKIDGLLFVLGIDFSLLRTLFSMKFKRWLKKVKPDIIHSNLFSADLIVANSLKSKEFVFVNTIHGDYLRHYYGKLKSIRATKVLDFRKTFAKVLKKLDLIVCITDKQIGFADEVSSDFGLSLSYKKIYNGYRMPENVITVTRESLSIPENAFVLGMVARGIKEKGWEELINAFEQLSLNNAYLVLVGGGAFIEQMKRNYTNSKIVYVGEVVNPLEYISFFDVACLPSYSENLPTSIIEYVFCRKPVIATNTGEVAAMLNIRSEKECGVLIETGSPSSMIEQLKEKILFLFQNKDQVERLRHNTVYAAEKFDMADCVKAHEEVYQELLTATHNF